MRASVSASTQPSITSSLAASATISSHAAARFNSTRPTRITWLATSIPSVRSISLASAPAATRAVVSRAEARSSTYRASGKLYFSAPARSA